MTSFRFEPLAEHHVEMLAEWLGRPHVAAWWAGAPTPDRVRGEYLLHLGDPHPATPYIAYLDDVPVGYIQSYVAMGGGDGWWPEATDPGVMGIDQFLADPATLDKGLGTRMISAFTRALFADPKVTRIQVDPSPDNARAIHCYGKVGFREIGPVATPDGPALLMVMARP